MLGKVQLELQKIVDGYVRIMLVYELLQISFCFLQCVPLVIKILCTAFQRSNVFKTITIPSESILNELRIVEVSAMDYSIIFNKSLYTCLPTPLERMMGLTLEACDPLMELF